MGTRQNIHPLTPTMVVNCPLSASSIYYDPWHPPYSIYVPDSVFPQSLCKFSLVYLLAWHLPLHTPYISSLLFSFRNTCRYHRPKIIGDNFFIVDCSSTSRPMENSWAFLVVCCLQVISIQSITQTASARVLYLSSSHTFTVQSHLKFCNLYHGLITASTRSGRVHSPV